MLNVETIPLFVSMRSIMDVKGEKNNEKQKEDSLYLHYMLSSQWKTRIVY